MNKRNKVIIAGATTLVAAGLMLAVVANGVGNFLGTYAEGTIYTLTLNSSNGGSGFSSSYSSSEQTNTAARTTKGNEIDFNYKNAKQSSGNYVDLAANGYFYNTTKLTGLESVRVIYSGAENALEIATSSTTTFSDGAALSTDTQYDIDVNMDYFRIRNLSGSAVQISSVIVKYACATRVAYYNKVNSTSELTNGQYLIVYEDGNYAFDSSKGNDTSYEEVTISNDAIVANSTTNAYAVTIDVSAGTIKTSGGKYIGRTSNSNGTDFKDTILTNTISVSDGDATILSSGGAYLRFNTDGFFRYYKSSSYTSQKAVQLYKKNGSSGGDTPTPTPTPETTYELVTNGLSAGDEVVVVAQTSRTATSGYALNSTIYNSYYLTAVNATMSDQKLTYSDDMTLWTVGGTSGAYTLYAQDASKYLYGYVNGTHLNVSVQSSAGEGSSWSITENSNADGYDVVTTYDSTQVYLEFMLYKSTTPEFTGYSSSSTTYPLNFYRKTTSSVDPVAVEGVSLNKSSLSLVQDASETLIATVTPNNATDKSVTWTSSNPGVATVDSTGKVTAVAAGSTTITVKTTDGEFTATCTVSVTAKVAVTGVSVSPTSKTLNKGETVTLTATVSPSTATNKNVTWSSNNTSIATVDSEGKVTGIAAGTATITVTTADGGKTATSTITVNPTPVSGVSLDQPAITLKVGASQTLVATVTPEDADNKDVTWSSSNTSVATVDSTGKVTAVAEGNATVTATSKGDSTKSAQCAVSVVQSSEPVVGSTLDLVESIDDLSSGDYIVIGESGNASVAGSPFSSTSSAKFMSSINATFSNSNKTVTLAEDMYVFEVGKSGSYWTFTEVESSKLLGATAAKKIDLGSGTTTWSISISEGAATISSTNEAYGSLFYNHNNGNPRYTTYTSSGLTTPQIYKQSGKVSGVSLDASDIGVNVGQTHTLTATISPASALNKNVSWSSSDSTVASVTNEGVVTGNKVGTATITVTTEDGSKTASCLVRVQSGSTIVPASISLDKTNEQLAVDATLQLTATVGPENAANKNVNWSSSNTSVATVSSTGLVTGKAASSTPVTITATSAANNSVYATCSITVSEVALDEWTLLFYVCGANLESGVGYDGYGINNPLGCATSDINEMLSASGQPDNVNIVLECGGSQKWKNSTIESHRANHNSRWHIRNKQLVHDEDITKANMGLTSTFQSFLSYGFENYPAKHYGVFMWNHGGAMDGCCFDELYSNNGLVNSEVYSAVTGARNAYNITNKLDFIAYDACLMAVQDVAEYNSLNFNYMISSQETEWDGGYDYDEWLPTLYSNPSTVSVPTLLEKIGETFMDYFENSGYYDQTQAVYDLSKMSTYLTKFESLASSMSSTAITDTIANKIKSCLRYGRANEGAADADSEFDTYDIKDVISKIKSYYSGLSTKFDEVTNALDDVIIYNRAGSDSTVKGSCGMSLFCPVSGYYTKSSDKTLILNNSHFTTWTNYGFAYQGV